MWISFSISLFFISSLFIIQVRGQDTGQDTLPTRILPTVDIEHWHKGKIEHTAFKFSVQADSLGQMSLGGKEAGATLQQLPGTFLRSMGGLGSAQTLSIRGFAADQTTLSINGIPYQSQQNGIINWGNFFLVGTQSVSLEQGASNPALNIAGGNINLGLEKATHPLAYLQIGGGSFGESRIATGTNLQTATLQCNAHLFLTQARNDFPFDWNEVQAKRPPNNFQHGQILLQLAYNLKRNQFQYNHLAFVNRQNIPGPVVKGNAGQSAENIAQKNIFHFIQHTYLFPNSTIGFYHVRTTLKHQYDFLDYHFDKNSYPYLNQNFLIQIESEQVLKKHWLTYLVQLESANLYSTNLVKNLQLIDFVQRKQINASIAYRTLFTTEKWFYRLQTLVRLNVTNDFSPQLSIMLEGQAGTLNERLAFFARGTQGVRLPNFNELYYFGYGNPNLPPEQSRTLQVGILSTYGKKLMLRPKCTFFYNQTLNKIISIPLSPVRWSTTTLGKTFTPGVEVGTALTYKQLFSASAYYTYQKAIDRTLSQNRILPYSPQEIVQAQLEWHIKNLSVFAQILLSGWRYTSLENLPQEILAEYYTLDAGLRYRFIIKNKLVSELKFWLQNLNDSRFAHLAAYPAPGRSFRFEFACYFLYKNEKK